MFVYFEHLSHGLAVYSGLVIVARLGSLVGPLLYLLLGMGLLAPLVYGSGAWDPAGGARGGARWDSR